MPAIDTDDLSTQFVSQYRDNVFCNKQKVLTCTCETVGVSSFYLHVYVYTTILDGAEVC